MLGKYIFNTLILILGMLAALVGLAIVMIATRTVFLTIVSGLGIIYVLYSSYWVIKHFLDK